jgi:hypothetical protein
MLSNPIYYGAFLFGGVQYDGNHDPIISKQLYDNVQRILQIRRPTIRSADISKPFTKLIRCATCGMSITTEHQKGHTYYRCSRKSRTVDCRSPYVREEVMETLISNLLLEYVVPKPVLDELLTRFVAPAESEKATRLVRIQEKQKQRLHVSEQLNLLADMLINGEIDRPMYVKKQNELQSKRASLKEQIQALERNQAYWFEPVRKWINTAQMLDKIARSGTVLEKRRIAVEVFGLNLTLNGKILLGRAMEPWPAASNFATHRNSEPMIGIEPMTSSFAPTPFSYTAIDVVTKTIDGG